MTTLIPETKRSVKARRAGGASVTLVPGGPRYAPHLRTTTSRQ
jgi:hypothetical protein